jgi:hypothetical protein
MASGSKLKWLSITDEFSREGLCLKVARSNPPLRTSSTPWPSCWPCGTCRGFIRCDYFPEFSACEIGGWLAQVHV